MGTRGVLGPQHATTCVHCLQVNERLQTSDPDVYAIGDIALFPQPRYGGEKARQEHVQVRCTTITFWSDIGDHRAPSERKIWSEIGDYCRIRPG